jgi:hypothetical protein
MSLTVEEVDYYPEHGLRQVKTMSKAIWMKVGAKSSYQTY